MVFDRLKNIFKIWNILGKLILSLSLAAVVSSVVFLLFNFGIFNWVDLDLTDRLFIREPVSNEVVIIGIDDRSIQGIGEWPWSRVYHGKLIQKLEEAGARVIGYDVTFAEKGIGDKEFFEIINQYNNLVFPVEGKIALQKNQFPKFKEPLFPLAEILEKHSIGYSLLITDQDGKVRRAPFFVVLNEDRVISPFFIKILEKAGKIKEPLSETFGPTLAVNGHLYHLNQFGLYRIFFFGPRNTFKKFSFIDVLENKIDLTEFNNKIVLIGAEAPNLHDEYFTPSSGAQAISGVEIHANLIESFLQRKTLREILDPRFNFLIFFGLSLIASFSIFNIRLRIALPLFLPYVFIYLVAVFISFAEGIILSIFYPLAVLGLTYILGLVLRYLLIKEEKRKLKKYFSLYVSREVVDEILAHPEKIKLGGETKNLTILFSDIRGFTTISEKMEARSLVELLNKYLTAMAKIILENRGVVDKFIGDAIMAFWGAPLPLKNHAEAAVRTALLMTRRLKECNEEWKNFDYPEIKIGLGLNTGEAVVGNIGSSERFDYTVIGDNVNLASRLEGLTKFYSVNIIIADSTAKEVKDKFVLRQIDCVVVKGKAEAVKIYEVMGFKEEENGFKDLKEKFATGFDLYLKREWDAAKRVFEAILAKYPTDGPSKVLKKRVEEYLASPPTVFDGAYHLDFK